MAAPPASVFENFPLLKRPTNDETFYRGLPPAGSVRGSFGLGGKYFQLGKKATTMSKKPLNIPTLNPKTGLYETDFDTLKFFLADPYRDRPFRTTDEMELRRHDRKGRPPNPVSLIAVSSLWKAMKVRGEDDGKIYFRGLNPDGSVNLGQNTRYFTPITLQEEVRSTDKARFDGLAKTGNETLLKTIQKNNNPDITVPGKRSTIFHIPLPNNTSFPVCAVPLELDGYADIVRETLEDYLLNNIKRGASQAKDATIGRLLEYGEEANDHNLVNSLLILNKDTIKHVDPAVFDSLYDADNLDIPAPAAPAAAPPAPVLAPTMPAIQAPQMQSIPPIPVAVSNAGSRRGSGASISDSVSNPGTPKRLSGGSKRRSSNGKKRKRTSSGSRKSADVWDDDAMLAALNSPGGAASSSAQLPAAASSSAQWPVAASSSAQWPVAASSSAQWPVAASSSEPWQVQQANPGYDFRNFNWDDSDEEGR